MLVILSSILVVISYLTTSFSSLFHKSGKITSFINQFFFVFMIFDFLMSKLLGVVWFKVEWFQLLVFFEIIIFHRLRNQRSSLLNRLNYFPLVHFTFFLLLTQYSEIDYFGFFIIGSILIDYLLRVKEQARFYPWNDLGLILISCLLVFFFQFNVTLSLSPSFIFIIYLIVGKRSPVLSVKDLENPFHFPLVARTVLYGAFANGMVSQSADQGWLTVFVVLTFMYCFSQVFQKDYLGKWALYNRGVENAFFLVFFIFGTTALPYEFYSMFIWLSLGTTIPLLFNTSFGLKYQRLTFLIGGLVAIYLSGLGFGQTHNYLTSLVERVQYEGLKEQYLIVLTLVTLFSVSYYIPFLCSRRNQSVVN